MTNNLPKITVVIPTYNRGHLLNRTIPSYFQENVGEVIVVNDCSIDNTVDVLSNLKTKYTNLSIIINDKNIKQTGSKNKGILAAKYDYIYFGDDDSYITDGAIKILLNVLLKKKCDIASARSLYLKDGESEKELFIRCNRFAKNSKDIFNFNSFRSDFTLQTLEPIKIPCSAACFIIKTSVAKKIYFSTIYIGNCIREETDFLIRALAKGYLNYYVSQACQINLPREISYGGSHLHHKSILIFHAVINNSIFAIKNFLILIKLNSYITPFIVLFLPIISLFRKMFITSKTC